MEIFILILIIVLFVAMFIMGYNFRANVVGGADGPTVEDVFDKFMKANPDIAKYNPQLASGWPRDSKGPGTSDVDIVIHVDSPDKVQNMVFNCPMDLDFDKLKGRAIYTPVTKFDREVNVYVSANTAVLRSVKHAENEKMLCEKYPDLCEKVMDLKKAGTKTEPAWAQVLELDGDPYEVMLSSAEILLDAAKKVSSVTGGDLDPKNFKLYVKPEYFMAIKDGKKTIETRAGSLEKWSAFDGAECEFINTESKETVKKHIKGLKHYKSVAALLKAEKVENIMPGKTAAEATNEYEKFYPKELIEKRGGICALYLVD